jgi:hypothetical protein
MKRAKLAILFDFACRAAAGLILGAPAAAVVAASGIGSFPEGDRLLFSPGGTWFLEIVRASFALLPALATSSLATGALLGAGLVVPQAALVTALAEGPPEPLRVFLGRAGARVPALLGLTGLAFLTQVLVGALMLGLAGFTRERLVENAMRADAAALAILAVGLVLVLALGLLRDLGAAALACGAPGTRGAIREGFRCLRQAPGAAFARWLGPHVLGLALVSAGALATAALDVSRPHGARLFAVVLLHQGIILGLCACRAAWLDGAIRVLTTTPTGRGASSPPKSHPAAASIALR